MASESDQGTRPKNVIEVIDSLIDKLGKLYSSVVHQNTNDFDDKTFEGIKHALARFVEGWPGYEVHMSESWKTSWRSTRAFEGEKYLTLEALEDMDQSVSAFHQWQSNYCSAINDGALTLSWAVRERYGIGDAHDTLRSARQNIQHAQQSWRRCDPADITHDSEHELSVATLWDGLVDHERKLDRCMAILKGLACRFQCLDPIPEPHSSGYEGDESGDTVSEEDRRESYAISDRSHLSRAAADDAVSSDGQDESDGESIFPSRERDPSIYADEPRSYHGQDDYVDEESQYHHYQ